MGEVLRAEWFDLAVDTQNSTYAWLHDAYLPAMCAADGIAWVGHYEIVEQPDRPYIEGAPRKKTTNDPTLPTGWRNVILTAAASPEVYFGPGNPIDALEEAHAVKLSARLNYRNAVFIEEEVINSPEQHTLPYGMGPPPAMQLGNYNCDTPDDEIELAKWYRAERFPRVSVAKGMIRGRKLLSITGWPKHGVLWEVTDLPPEDFNVEARFLDADRNDKWNGRHVLEYVTHTFQGPHCGRRVWPEIKNSNIKD